MNDKTQNKCYKSWGRGQHSSLLKHGRWVIVLLPVQLAVDRASTATTTTKSCRYPKAGDSAENFYWYTFIFFAFIDKKLNTDWTICSLVCIEYELHEKSNFFLRTFLWFALEANIIKERPSYTSIFWTLFQCTYVYF